MRFLLIWLVAASALGLAARADASWYQANSKHFIIYADATPEELRDYGTKLERFDQAVRMARAMDDPPLTDSNRLTIYQLRDPGELVRLTGDPSILGFYVAHARGSLAFVARKKARFKGDIDSDIVFFHEYAHHLMLQASTAALPEWLVEGSAEFLSTAQLNVDGTVTFGAAANHRAMGILALHHELPLTMMIKETYGDLTGWQTELVYARGWLLTHYLTFEPSRRGQLDRYVAGIQRGMTSLESANAAFGELATLDRELNRYAERKQLTGLVFTPDASKLSTVSVRPLTAAEAAMMPVRLRSEAGVTRKMAPTVAAQARKLAAPYPSDAFAQTALAEAEYDAKNYPAADAAADKALAADPRNVHALIYKGLARMELAKANPASANWAEVRSWFAKANRLDTENAEPLMLYYQTFMAAGAQPTDSATKGLLYALVLAPQDGQLRLLASRQLLKDGRAAEAKQAIAPLAFDPHGGALRDIAKKVVGDMDRGDSTGAVKLIDDWEKPVEKGN